MDGELSLAEQEAVRAHLKSCEACTAAYEKYRKLQTLFASTLTMQPPASLEKRIKTAMRAQRRSRWLRIGSSVAAVMVVGLCVFQAVRGGLLGTQKSQEFRGVEGAATASPASQADEVRCDLNGMPENATYAQLYDAATTPVYTVYADEETVVAQLWADCAWVSEGLLVRVTAENMEYVQSLLADKDAIAEEALEASDRYVLLVFAQK